MSGGAGTGVHQGYTFDDVPSDAAHVVLSDVTSYLAENTTTPDFALLQTDGPFRYRRGSHGPTVGGTSAELADCFHAIYSLSTGCVFSLQSGVLKRAR